MKRIKSTIVFVFILAIILSSNREVYAMTPPSSDELREAYRYSVERSREIMQEPMENEVLAEIVPILDNTDAYFVFQAMNISEIESEEQLSKLIDEANSDTIDQTNAIWVATQWNADDTYGTVKISRVFKLTKLFMVPMLPEVEPPATAYT